MRSHVSFYIYFLAVRLSPPVLGFGQYGRRTRGLKQTNTKGRRIPQPCSECRVCVNRLYTDSARYMRILLKVQAEPSFLSLYSRNNRSNFGPAVTPRKSVHYTRIVLHPEWASVGVGLLCAQQNYC